MSSVSSNTGTEFGQKKTKKRNRDSDLLEPLRDKPEERDFLPKSLEFHEITNIEASLCPLMDLLPDCSN